MCWDMGGPDGWRPYMPPTNDASSVDAIVFVVDAVRIKGDAAYVSLAREQLWSYLEGDILTEEIQASETLLRQALSDPKQQVACSPLNPTCHTQCRRFCSGSAQARALVLCDIALSSHTLVSRTEVERRGCVGVTFGAGAGGGGGGRDVHANAIEARGDGTRACRACGTRCPLSPVTRQSNPPQSRRLARSQTNRHWPLFASCAQGPCLCTLPPSSPLLLVLCFHYLSAMLRHGDKCPCMDEHLGQELIVLLVCCFCLPRAFACACCARTSVRILC
jgi:hypothetical protein